MRALKSTRRGGGMPDYEKLLQDSWIQAVVSGFSTPVADGFVQHQ